MVAVLPVLPQWSHLGGGTSGTGGGCVAGFTTVVTLRRRDRWWLCGRCYHSGYILEDGLCGRCYHSGHTYEEDRWWLFGRCNHSGQT